MNKDLHHLRSTMHRAEGFFPGVLHSFQAETLSFPHSHDWYVMAHFDWRCPSRLSTGKIRPLWLTAGQSYQNGKLDFPVGKPLPYLYTTIYQNMFQ